MGFPKPSLRGFASKEKMMVAWRKWVIFFGNGKLRIVGWDDG